LQYHNTSYQIFSPPQKLELLGSMGLGTIVKKAFP